MTNELLIDRGDIALYRSLPQSLSWEDLTPIILNVQRGWVRQSLGLAQYRDLHVNQTDSKYQNLLNGTVYTLNGETVDFFGLKPAIALYTYAVYLKQADLRLTPSGNKRKRANQSDNSTEESIDKEYQKAMGEAGSYLRECLLYLANNSTTFPLFKGIAQARDSIRIGTAQHKDFYSEDENWRGYGYPYNYDVNGY